jgi:type VI protein secretion system component Hcp
MMKPATPSTRFPATTITAPRDAGSGLPTGKRQHKPIVITQEPKSAGKANFNEFTMKKKIDKASP